MTGNMVSMAIRPYRYPGMQRIR